MKRLNLCLEKVKAVFISHEHSDHISGVQTLSKKYKLPVYITGPTLSYGGLKIGKEFIYTFIANQAVTVGGLEVYAFPKWHDAADPYSFVVSYNSIRVGVFTDIGAPCNNVIRYFKQCHAAFLETNYDEEMLLNGRYPVYLKKRIHGSKGHMSNTQALELFLSHRPTYMSHILLSHLSRDNNSPELVKELFDRHAGNTRVVVASRYQESEVFKIEQTADGDRPLLKIMNSLPQPSQLQFQF
jgi:phosphoribosyl 1,2-cyclic phosphodiesterase